MKRTIKHLASVLTLVWLANFGTSGNLHACAVDVTINAGDTVSMCSQSIVDLTASAGFTNYVWSGAGTASGQTITPAAGGWYYVNALDASMCVSQDSVFVIINTSPTPIISSSAGLIICPGGTGTTLSLDQAYSSQVWSTGETTPTIQVTDGATYSVAVTSTNGCAGTADITIDKPVFTMGPVGSPSVCSGSSVVLEATGGDAYDWSTGEFGSSISVAPTQLTTYTVTIFKGSCSQTLSTDVGVISMGQFSLPEAIFVKPGTTEYVSGPANFNSYLWEPAEVLTSQTDVLTGFIGTESTWVYLTAVGSQCTITDSVIFVVVNLTIPEGFSPNGDGKNDNFVVPELDQLTAKLKVWNRWGDLVYDEADYQNNWDGKCKGPMCVGGGDLPEGTYFYQLDVEEILFEGMIVLKR